MRTRDAERGGRGRSASGGATAARGNRRRLCCVLAFPDADGAREGDDVSRRLVRSGEGGEGRGRERRIGRERRERRGRQEEHISATEMAEPQALPQERYAVWKKNTPLLYRQLQTSSLLWPSLTLDWLPDTTAPQTGDKTYTQHRLVQATFSAGANPLESVLFTALNLVDLHAEPCTNLQNYDYSPATGEFTYSLPTPRLENTRELTQVAVPAGSSAAAPTITPDAETTAFTEQSGPSSQKREPESTTETPDGSPLATQRAKVNNSLGLIQRIPHPGDIHRVKHCPHNPDLIATASDSGAVRIFDRTRKPNNYNDSDFHPTDPSSCATAVETSDILLQYHTSESWTLDWNMQKPYTLVTASSDGSIAVWNLDAQFKAPPRQKFSTLDSKFRFSTCTLTTPHYSLPAHNYGVNEVRWVPDHDSLLVSAGEDGSCRLWDVRSTSKTASVKFPTFALDEGTDALNTVDVDPFQTFNLVSGTASGAVRFLDLRNPQQPPHQTQHTAHTGPITSSRFSPHLRDTFATSSADATAIVWQQKTPVFTHGGHLLSVSDVVWCPSEPGVLASCSYDNSVHIWQPVL